MKWSFGKKLTWCPSQVQFPCRRAWGKQTFCWLEKTVSTNDFFHKSVRRESRFAKALHDNFLRPKNSITPKESTLNPHRDPAIVLLRLRRFVTDHAMNGAVHRIFLLDFGYVEPMHDLDQRMDRILKIVAPLDNGAAFG